jgi:hypothetical protein
MTDENSDIKDLDPCLPEDYLRAFATGRVTDQGLRAIIEAHVELCAECAAKVRSFQRTKLSPDELLEKQMASLRQRQEAVRRQQAQGPRPGTIWRTLPWTKSDQSGPLVFVLSYTDTAGKKFLTVAEVSEDISQAIETDMLLEPHESGLRFRCMVRAGNIFVMDPKDLEKSAGELPHQLTEKVLEFCRLGERFDDRVPLSQIVFLRDTEGHKLMRRKGIISGIQVTGNDDPRLVTATKSRRLCEYLHVAEPVHKKSESRRVDKNYLTSLLTGLVSELSMWGSLLIPPSTPAYAGGEFTESASLRRRSSISRHSLEDSTSPEKSPAPVKVEVRPGPTREEVCQRQPEQRQFKHGDQINLSVTVPEDGYLVIVHYCEQTAELEIVYPSPEEKFPRVSRNQAIRIERQLMSPPGRYGFKVIFSRERLLQTQRETAPAGEQTLQNLMALVERIEELDEGTWREATFEYEVVKKKGLFSRWFS